MTESDIACPIWGNGYSADGYYLQDIRTWVIKDSPRAGGGYRVGQIGLSAVRELEDSQKSRLTTHLIDLRMQGVEWPIVTEEMAEDAKNGDSLRIPERAERLLRYFADHSQDIGAGHYIGLGDSAEWRALAWSESKDWLRVFKIAEYLASKHWIKLSDRGGSAEIEVLVDGYSRVAQESRKVDYTQAFVAMWIDDEMNAAYDCGIKPAIEEAGYKSIRIDRERSVDKIDDAIIANIRKSRFLVADFTHGKKGARGSVYYEAGFAHGLNIPVIFACRKDMINSLHFDTRQYAHIEWESPQDLRTKLLDKIIAFVVDRPENQSGM